LPGAWTLPIIDSRRANREKAVIGVIFGIDYRIDFQTDESLNLLLLSLK
jgi:hypothetical protein